MNVEDSELQGPVKKKQIVVMCGPSHAGMTAKLATFMGIAFGTYSEQEETTVDDFFKQYERE